MPATSPEDTCREFRDSMRRGDLESALDVYDPDAVFLSRTGDIRRGRDGLREELTPFAAAGASFDYYVKRVIQSGDIALLHTLWCVSSPGKQTSLYAVGVARRRPDGTWRWLIGDPSTFEGNCSSTVYWSPGPGRAR